MGEMKLGLEDSDEELLGAGEQSGGHMPGGEASLSDEHCGFGRLCLGLPEWDVFQPPIFKEKERQDSVGLVHALLKVPNTQKGKV